VGGTRRQLDEVGLIAAIPVRLMRQSHALIIRLGPYSALGVR
jgi:hypothetical protein